LQDMLVIVLLICSSLGRSYKFLVFNPQFGTSHVNFMSQLSDALIGEGHEVVMISPRTDMLVGTPKTKAVVYEVHQGQKAAAFEESIRQHSSDGTLATVWLTPDVFKQIKEYYPMLEAWKDQCEVTVSDRELIDSVRREHFDAGFTEPWNSCGYALFHLLNVSKYATINSMALMDGMFSITEVPVNTAYTPTMIGGSAGDRMSFFARLINTLVYLKIDSFMEYSVDLYQSMLKRVTKDPPNMQRMMRETSLVFMNSDPLADFPKLTSPRVIDIGGISVHAGHDDLDEYWSSVLDRRNHTIFISFGTFVKSHLMPEAYKETIKETVKKFADVTFVWKYEKPEHNISGGIDNLVETTWAPQHDLLHDDRLTAFITHGGQGSITESAGAGVPLICIPVTSHQFRNGRQVERSGVGIVLAKEELGSMGKLEQAIEKILKDESFKYNAATLANMIDERPFSMKDVFVRNIKFLAKFGPHRRFDHYGAQLSFVQYYLIDVFTFLALIAVSSICFALYLVKLILEHIPAYFIFKKVKSN
ncbi:hypothetical protein PMAYCL1PPCAC_15826, partial [Pristionchus mayeri]